MEKAFDFKDLGARLVKRLKKVAVGAADDTLSWAGESCVMSQNNIVKGLGGVVLGIKGVVVAEVAKAVGEPAPAAALSADPR